MTTRGQNLRSSTPGNMPAAGTRQPGEIWMNFPDLQLGMIDASRNAQKLIAVRYFSTTANYAVGDFVVQAGVLYVANSAVTAGAFNASKWTKITTPSDLSAALGAYMPFAGGTFTGPIVAPAGSTIAGYLPLAGGTLTGKLTLSGPPTSALDAATKAYVDAGAFVPIGGGTMTGDLILNRNPQVPLGAVTKQYIDALPTIGDNRIINGDMRIDQRNNGASGTASNVYTVDRWTYGGGQPNKGAWVRGTTGGGLPGFPYALSFNSSSALTPAAGDTFAFYQPIEADMISDFAWGSANAQPVTLSFWTTSTLAGTFSGTIQNDTETRSYPFSFSIPTANIWTKVALTVPGDTSGTWVMSGNGVGLYLMFDLGSGSTRRGAAGAWVSGNIWGVTGAQRIVATNGAQFYLTGVKLEIGSVATPFNRQSLAKSLADCQRYYQVSNGGWGGTKVTTTSGGFALDKLSFPPMRVIPTITITAPNYAGDVTNIIPGNIWADGFSVNVTLGSSTFWYAVTTGYTASAEL